MADPSDYKHNIVVYFHGFKSAVPNGTYKRLRKRLKKTHTVLGVNYDYLDPATTIKNLEQFYETQLKGHQLTVVGSSLGGLWADYFGSRFGAEKIVLLNPISKPLKQLMKYADTEHMNVRRQLKLSVSREQIMAYAALEQEVNTKPKRFVILAQDDKKLDFRVAQRRYEKKPGTQIKLYEKGGHTINLKKHPAVLAIVAFVRGEEG